MCIEASARTRAMIALAVFGVFRGLTATLLHLGEPDIIIQHGLERLVLILSSLHMPPTTPRELPKNLSQIVSRVTTTLIQNL